MMPLNPLPVIELFLRIVLLSLESASPEQRQTIIRWFIEDIERHRKWAEDLTARWEKFRDGLPRSESAA